MLKGHRGYSQLKMDERTTARVPKYVFELGCLPVEAVLTRTPLTSSSLTRTSMSFAPPKVPTGVSAEADLIQRAASHLQRGIAFPKGDADSSGWNRRAKRILLPYSGSESADCALEAAIQLFSGVPSEVRVVHLRDWIPGHGGRFFLRTKEDANAIVTDATIRLRCMGFDVTSAVRESYSKAVPQRILAEAAECNAAVIVLATRRRRALGALLLGSVSFKVMSKALCPVVLVHNSGRPR